MSNASWLINIHDIHMRIRIVSRTCAVLVSRGLSWAGSRAAGLNVISLRVSGFLYWPCFLSHSKRAGLHSYKEHRPGIVTMTCWLSV